MLQTVLRIRKDPHHLAGSGILDADPDPADPDPRPQIWHLINLFSAESIVNKFKYIYANLIKSYRLF
jgi:hypothetical protein